MRQTTLDGTRRNDFTCAMPRFCPCALLVAILAVRAVANEPIRASGVLTPMMDIEVGSELLGTIIWMADEGAVVTRGEPLVKLRDSIEVLTVELRKAQVDTSDPTPGN